MASPKMKHHPALAEAKESKKRIRKLQSDASKIRDLISDEKEKADDLYWSAMQEFAKHGDIAINGRIARRLRHEMPEDYRQELDAYVELCAMYESIQKAFSLFYKSESFAEICKMVENGWRPRGIYRGRIRPADSDYRPFNYRHRNLQEALADIRTEPVKS